MMLNLPVLSLLLVCVEQILSKKAHLSPIAVGSAQFGDLKIMLLAYEVIFTSVFLSCSWNDIRIHLDSCYLLRSRAKKYVHVDTLKRWEGKQFTSCEMLLCQPF